MKHKLWLAGILLFLLAGFHMVLGQQSFLIKNDIVVAEDEVQENVITFGGRIHIKGRVKQTAIAFGGTIIVEGEVGEVVLGFGTDIILRPNAAIRGDVACLGGTLEKHPGAIIEGDTIYFKASDDVSKLLREGLFGRAGISLIPLLIILRLIMAFIWFILAVILVAIFPRQIIFGAGQIKKSFWPIAGTGFLSIIIFAGLVVFSALLSLALVGIPILLSLIIIGIIIKIFGQVILFYFFGESIYKAFSRKPTPPLLAVTLGFLLITLIGLIPILGAVFSFGLSLIGWGIVIRTKFGTTENWFRKSV